MASRFPGVGFDSSGPLFCSQVVGQAFADFGKALLPDKQPFQIYPGMIADSPLLLDVSSDCVREVRQSEQAVLYAQILKAAEHELPGSEMQMNRQVFERLRDEIGGSLPTDVHSLSDVCNWLSNSYATDAAKSSDETILKILDQEGMFEWLENFSGGAESLINILEFAATAAELSASDTTRSVNNFSRF